MMNDLFVSLDYNRFAEILTSLEGRVDELIACRHEYPIWPAHGESPSDSYEQEFFYLVRHPYYQNTILLIKTLRLLRELGQLFPGSAE